MRTPGKLARHFGIVERMRHALDGLAGLVALAGDQQQVVGAAEGGHAALRWRHGGRRRASIQFRRSAGMPRRISARIAAGSSLRGLSSVTRVRSARRVAISPITGRLARSRSPPQPNTTTSLPLANGRKRAPAPSPAPRACGHSRHRPARRYRWRATSCSRPGAPLRFASAATARAGSPPVATTRPSAASALEAWKPPTSGSSTSWRVPSTSIDEMLAGRRRLVAHQPEFPALGAVGPEANAAPRGRSRPAAAARSLSALTTAVPPAGSRLSNSRALAAK